MAIGEGNVPVVTQADYDSTVLFYETLLKTLLLRYGATDNPNYPNQVYLSFEELAQVAMTDFGHYTMQDGIMLSTKGMPHD